jgi:hypothetical protein
VQGVLKREKWKTWFEACEHTEQGWLEEAWASTDRGEEEAEARTNYKGGGTVRVTVHKGRDVKVSIRPLHHLTRFLHTMPTLEEGEGVAVTAEKESSGDSRSEEMDAMAEQECFFGTNAMPNKPVCKVRKAKGMLGTSITPMGWGEETRGGDWGIRYYCHTCRSLSKEGSEKMGTCPIPREVLTQGSLDAESPILRKEVGREEFDEWMRKLPRGKSGGPDEMTYEMWQEAPDPMRELLWRSVNSVLAGSPLPEEWTGAFTKLIVKKAGAEGELEDLSEPVCLMSTAAKIITGIWAHRLSTTLEARGVRGRAGRFQTREIH